LSGDVHEAAAVGFDRGAGSYERGRPSYPQEAISRIVEYLAIGGDTTLVDLAAGTGKFTRLLVPTGARIIAVEPVAAMRAELAAQLPAVETLDGTAEAIPMADASVDVLTVAQAFHWFDLDRALAEIARVLRPGGGMAMLWNRRDESEPWVAAMSRIIGWHDRPIAHYDSVDWPAVVAKSGSFTPLERFEVSYEHVIDRELLRERVYSISYIATMNEAERTRLGDEVVALAQGFPDEFPLPYRTVVHWCHAR
jgi:SAM-dependent methyltransferase